jgi:hypothetical protein
MASTHKSILLRAIETVNMSKIFRNNKCYVPRQKIALVIVFISLYYFPL